MFSKRVGSWIKGMAVIVLVGGTLELVTTDAEARAGRGRSSGRSSSSSRSDAQPQTQAPPPAGQAAMGAPARGGMMRSMAGGLAGGFLGSMLFSSFAGADTGEGGGRGGIGFLEVALFAGLAYFGFRWWKGRQQAAGAFGAIAQRHRMPDSSSVAPPRAASGIDFGQMRAFSTEGISTDAAQDLFFKVQGAWTRRDLSSVAGLLGKDVELALERDLRDLRDDGQINRLENISVRSATVVRTWHEHQAEHSTVRFTASLLDYTVDEATGQVVEGSDSAPVKFEEEWTFARFKDRDAWLLVGIHQV